MNNLEKYLDQVIEQKPPIAASAPPEPQQESQFNLGQCLLRRWHIVFLVSLVILATAMPAIWLLVKPKYVVVGSIHVVPLLPSVLTGEPDRGEISNYDNYLNTQAQTIVSGPMIQRVATYLADQDLAFFERKPSDLISRLKEKLRMSGGSRTPESILKGAISSGIIAASPIRRSEYIGVTMKSRDDREARQIVDAFLLSFELMYGSSSRDETTKTLTGLESEEGVLKARIERQQGEIRKLAQEAGTTVLDVRQEMEMQRQTALWIELARLGAQKIGLEASIAVLEQAGDVNAPGGEQVVAARKEFINADSMVEELTRNIVQLKRDLLIARQTLAEGNPELKRKQDLLESFEKSLKEKEEQLSQDFEKEMKDRTAESERLRLAAAKAELEQLNEREARLQAVLNEQDTTTRKVGQASVDLQDRQFNLRIDQEMHDQILRRIKNIEMERQRQARIKIAWNADVAGIEDKRVKYSAGVAFLAIGCGLGLALLRDKMDKTLQTPDDLTRHLDLPIIGTTTSSRTVKPALFAEQIAGDYQTIRANLGLLSSGGMPRRLAVSSAGTREGKTTFAVNLATSLAKSGKKVLLIDGDLRKPDIGYMLSISNGSAGLQDVLLGENPGDIIRVVPSSGLHVLVANPRNLTDVYELLTSSAAAEHIERLSRQYDHLIVDTPPVLAFPDALVWAKLTDAVVLVSFAGQTTAPDLREARERFARVRARVVGTVLSNVSVDQSLFRYGYGYRAQSPQARYRARATKKLLLSSQGRDGETNAKKA